MSQFTSHSPPPLRHPVPTHPAYIPEPPSTPVSPQGYQRFSSSPAPGQPQQNAHLQPPYSHVPAYTTPFQHSQQQQQHHHPQPIRQPLPPQPGGSQPPDWSAWGMNDATAQFGMQLGQSAVAAGQDYVQRNFGGWLPGTNAFKHHFNVSNSYVMWKMSIVLFPWIHKPWSRRIRRHEQGQTEWQTPREDVNSPDLYIPVMAMLTYVLLASSLSTLRDPKVLGECASRAFGVVLLDFLFVKLGCYILNVQASIVDLVAYGGYKFVGVILTLVTSLLPGLPNVTWKVVFVYAFLANAFFLLRSLRSVVLPDPSISTNPTSTSTATASHAQRRRRITFLFLEAVCQIVYMSALVRV
ncbi:YIF1-domain-containing protein [Pluteus cervinus]|uniref:YIF1-domain-containing protein n=1 Tax=Pluteus cervinus TaxID=181527 RepID=A0ACD3ALC6_9AGAR|nr:YIF1-domain-containing protein [Pluteus cervinus]